MSSVYETVSFAACGLNCKNLKNNSIASLNFFLIIGSHPVLNNSNFFYCKMDAFIVYQMVKHIEFIGTEDTFSWVSINSIIQRFLICMSDMFNVLFKGITEDKTISNIYPDEFALLIME